MRGGTRLLWVLGAIALLGWPWLTDDKFLHHIGVLLCITSIAAASLHLIIRTGHVSLAHAAFMGVGAYGSTLAMISLHLPRGARLVIGPLPATPLAPVPHPILRPPPA